MGRRRKYEDIIKSEYVSISELVQITSVRYSTVKYYTEEGLLPFEQKEERLTRRYPRELASLRLKHIVALKEKGLSITEIKEHFKV
ncbi:helix-turn-helix domain-containing protein [Cytobacillus sp. IB215665]|uniref:helix-turn-helix domain-containing protein n=1 Tax=Cytobacillus sp. IB215665 TaxID=3097357 RepID=UPI002A140D29|nr:helix-turn-helix domain-containing protein [Cytobacillus sp. IB215665]MDX8367462.1 helix-turn-helix domain-containing protein [Cytobacillus sp. IB215665]